jgi:hypothetical protein
LKKRGISALTRNRIRYRSRLSCGLVFVSPVKRKAESLCCIRHQRQRGSVVSPVASVSPTSFHGGTFKSAFSIPGGTPAYENVYRQENKDAVVWARRLLQYCQLDKKFRDISRLIAIFFSTFLCFPRFLAETLPGNTGLGCGLDDPGFRSRQGQEVFLFSKASNPSWGPPNLLFNGYWGFSRG